MKNANERPLISVIIPVYNTEKYIDECIRSIVNQSYKNLEIIIIDDGSSDRSLPKCSMWAEADKRIKVFHQENQGLSVARNVGVSVSHGDYLSFVDSDDWIDENYYNTLITMSIEYDADIAATSVSRTYRNTATLYPTSSQIVFTPEEALSTVITGTVFTVMACNKLYKRDVILSNPFPEHRFHEDDFVMYKIVSSCKKLVFCHNVLYYYRQRSHGIINSGLENRFADKYCSYFQNLLIVKEKYPQLIPQMKLLLCQYVINDYTELIDSEGNQYEMMREKIIQYRKQIQFSIKELIQLDSIQQMKTIVFSSIFLKPYYRHKLSSMKRWREQYDYFE